MTDKQEDILVKIHEIVRWLENNGKSQDISGIVIALDDLAIASFYFVEQVSDAHAQMNEAEAIFKATFARSVSESKESTAKAERTAEVICESLRRDFVTWKNLYSKLRLRMDAIDKILDTHRQRVSLLKQMELKHG